MAMLLEGGGGDLAAYDRAALLRVLDACRPTTVDRRPRWTGTAVPANLISRLWLPSIGIAVDDTIGSGRPSAQMAVAAW